MIDNTRRLLILNSTSSVNHQLTCILNKYTSITLHKDTITLLSDVRAVARGIKLATGVVARAMSALGGGHPRMIHVTFNIATYRRINPRLQGKYIYCNIDSSVSVGNYTILFCDSSFSAI